MKRILVLILASISIYSCTKKASDKMATPTSKSTDDFRKIPPGAAPARPINLGEYTTFNLDNGLKVIVVENHKLPRVSYQISLNHDALVEGESAGYVSIAGDMIAKGTAKRSKAKLDEETDFIGATLNTSGNGLFASSLKKHSSKLLDLVTDVLYNPSFPKEEFDKSIKQTLDGLATAKTDANAIASNVANVVCYGKGHPYGEVETEKTIKAIKLDQCKQYYQQYFKPNNAYLVIVGDITPDEARKQANTYFATWKKGSIPEVKYNTPMSPSVPSVIFANKDGAVQSVINVVYPTNLTPGSPDELAGNVMNNILGGGIFSGRLMQNLREKKAYTYGARSNLNSDKLIGNFKAFASVRNAVTDSSVQEFLYEMRRMASEPVSQNDLNLAKNSMAGGFARSLESPQTIANFALNTFRYNLPKDYYNTYLSRLENISIADISAAAKKYVTPDRAYIVVVGNKEAVAERLLKYDGDGLIDYYDAYGEKLKINNQAIPAGVTAGTIIEDYIDAMGGKAKLQAVKSMATTAKMTVMGQEALVTKKQLASGYLISKIEMAGNVLMDQKLTPSQSSTQSMGRPAAVHKPGDKEYEDLKTDVDIFKQVKYNDPMYKLDLKEIENVDGSNCYKIVVTNPNGKQSTQYYDCKSSLLKRVVVTQGEGDKTMTMTSDYLNYKEISGGVMMPFEIKIDKPMPMTMVIDKYEVNTLSENDFK